MGMNQAEQTKQALEWTTAMDNWSSHHVVWASSVLVTWLAKTLFEQMPLSSSVWFNSSLLWLSDPCNYQTLQPGYVDRGDSLSRCLLITFSVICAVLGTQ